MLIAKYTALKLVVCSSFIISIIVRLVDALIIHSRRWDQVPDAPQAYKTDSFSSHFALEEM